MGAFDSEAQAARVVRIFVVGRPARQRRVQSDRVGSTMGRLQSAIDLQSRCDATVPAAIWMSLQVGDGGPDREVAPKQRVV